MGVLKTFSVGLSLACLASTAQADAGLLRHVTECVGRLSAQMEFHWMHQDKPSDRIERQRADLIDILEALTTQENATQVLAARIDAKMAHASLLTQSVFSQDSRIATWAADHAERNIDACSDILLEPPAPPAINTIAATDSTDDPQTMNQIAVHRR